MEDEKADQWLLRAGQMSRNEMVGLMRPYHHDESLMAYRTIDRITNSRANTNVQEVLLPYEEKPPPNNLINRVQQMAEEGKSSFYYFAALINDVRLENQFAASFDVFVRDELKGARVTMPEPKSKAILTQKIRKATEYFEQIGHHENLVVCKLPLFRGLLS